MRSTKEDNKMNDTPQSPPIKGLGKLIHIAGWGILFCSPFFFTGRESQVTFEGYFRSIIVPLSFMLVFYLNYGWLVRRYLFNRRTGRFLLINLLLIGATMLFVHLCMPVPGRGRTEKQRIQQHGNGPRRPDLSSIHNYSKKRSWPLPICKA